MLDLKKLMNNIKSVGDAKPKSKHIKGYTKKCLKRK